MTISPPPRSNPQERGNLTALTDEQLVVMCVEALEGDTRAFAELVTRHERMVRTNCRYLTRSEEDSWDLAQEVLIKAYGALNRFRKKSQFKTWLWRIKANHCLNYIERRKVREREEVLPVSSPVIRDYASKAADPLDRTASNETAKRVRDVLDSMSDSVRIPLVLRDLDGMTYPEISEHLSISVPAAKMRISRGRAEFRERFLERFPDAGGAG